MGPQDYEEDVLVKDVGLIQGHVLGALLVGYVFSVFLCWLSGPRACSGDGHKITDAVSLHCLAESFWGWG